jgi:hypothetical protein
MSFLPPVYKEVVNRVEGNLLVQYYDLLAEQLGNPQSKMTGLLPVVQGAERDLPWARGQAAHRNLER